MPHLSYHFPRSFSILLPVEICLLYGLSYVVYIHRESFPWWSGGSVKKTSQVYLEQSWSWSGMGTAASTPATLRTLTYNHTHVRLPFFDFHGIMDNATCGGKLGGCGKFFVVWRLAENVRKDMMKYFKNIDLIRTDVVWAHNYGIFFFKSEKYLEAFTG